MKNVSFAETREKCYMFKIGEQSLKRSHYSYVRTESVTEEASLLIMIADLHRDRECYQTHASVLLGGLAAWW